jgi:hypothetical protein
VAARWNPVRTRIERSVERAAERRTVLVAEGSDSSAYDRLQRRGTLRFGLTVAVLYVAIAVVPDRFGLVAVVVAPLACFAVLHAGSYRETAAAQAYLDGWLDGRRALCERLVDELPNGEDGLVGALRLEYDRDLEVLLDIRTSRAPDDLSGLDNL